MLEIIVKKNLKSSLIKKHLISKMLISIQYLKMPKTRI